MKIISWNVNGIRAWYNNGGLTEIMSKFNPDILIMQETKADDDRFDEYTCEYKDEFKRYHQGSSYKRGYAGVGMLVRNELNDLIVTADSIELESTYGSGRILHLEFPEFNLIGVYTLNSGDKDDLRKEWDEKFKSYISKFSKPVVIMGDINVVPSILDFYGNLEYARNTYPGLKDYERSNYFDLLNECKLIDTFRNLHPSQRTYSWFSYRGNSYDRNCGWRIDLALISNSLITKVKRSDIFTEVRYSDHCPILLELDL